VKIVVRIVDTLALLGVSLRVGKIRGVSGEGRRVSRGLRVFQRVCG
jgi:hypothetical protein